MPVSLRQGNTVLSSGTLTNLTLLFMKYLILPDVLNESLKQ